MAWTAANVAAVEAAITAIIACGGAQTLTLNGKRVTYYDLDALRDLRDEMVGEVYAEEQTTKASLRYRN